jgi:hypothetical protein
VGGNPGKGNEVTANFSYPGSRCLASAQIDTNGVLWMYGGVNGQVSGAYYSDLWTFGGGKWSYSSLTQQAALYPGLCMGSPTFPVDLYAASSWVSGTDFWIFGGLIRVDRFLMFPREL